MMVTRQGSGTRTIPRFVPPDVMATALADNQPMSPETALCTGTIGEPDRQLLEALAAGPVSGNTLAAALGLGRAAVWKRIEALREAGIAIEASPGRGYRLGQPLELLDAGRICAGLVAPVREMLSDLQVAWRLASSNSALLALPAPTQGTRVLLAEQQTAGRGRLGRAWASPLAANLYLSVDRRFQGGLARLPGLSLVAGIAAAEALREASALDIRLKWPNDLWLGERKLGGLLVEGGGEFAGPAHAVIGLGVNVAMPSAFAQGITQAWADLASHMASLPSRNGLAIAILDRLLPALQEFDREGLAAFHARWQALDALAGRDIDIVRDAEREPAHALGLADDGGLRVRLPDGSMRVVYSGEVSVRLPS